MAYSEFAYYYDSMMNDAFYDDYIDFINRHIHFQSAIELGCGTGEMTIRLLEQGKSIIATDISEEMLEVLQYKLLETDHHCDIYVMDMLDFEAEGIECILSFCDVINYMLNKEDILKVFKNVYRSLRRNGIFLFDVNSYYKHTVMFKDYYEHDEDEEFIFDWKVDSDDKGKISHHVSIEDKETKKIIKEEQTQKTYPLEVYIHLLEEAGFKDIKYYSDFSDYKEECEKIIFIGRKI